MKRSKAPIQLRVSVTDRCQLRCVYCMPEEQAGGWKDGGRDTAVWGKRAGILSYEEITTLAGCLHGEFGLSKLRLTGGEPLMRPRLDRLVGMLADLGIPDLALTTNAVRLAGEAARLKQAGLRRVNVSLDSLSPGTFRRLTGGGDLATALNGIDAALSAGLQPLKLNTVVIRGINDHEIVDLVDFGLRLGCEVRFIELMPIGPGATLFEDGFVDSETVRRRLVEHFDLSPVMRRSGSSACRYDVTDAVGREGVIGFISSCSVPFCAGCRRLRVTADGRLIGCLAKNGGVSIRERLRGGDQAAIGQVVRRALSGKTVDRVFEQKMAMAAIGG